MTKQRIIHICPQCGSDNVGQDAAVQWDVGAQEWRISHLFDDPGWCSDCDSHELRLLECAESERGHAFAAHKAGWRQGGDNGGFWYDGNLFESWKAAASADDAATYGTAREVCEGEGLLDDALAVGG